MNDSNKKLTKRDKFAISVMQILLADPDIENNFVDEDGNEMGDKDGDIGTWWPHTRFFGEHCFHIADGMLKASKKNEA